MMTVVASSSWGGLGWFWVPICALMMIGCMLMMGGMMRHGGHGWRNWYYGEHPDGNDQAQRRGSAERILADRLARGEIDVEEYHRLLAALQPNGDRARDKAAGPAG